MCARPPTVEDPQGSQGSCHFEAYGRCRGPVALLFPCARLPGNRAGNGRSTSSCGAIRAVGSGASSQENRPITVDKPARILAY